MWVELGNSDAVEGYRDPAGEDPEKVLYREVSGQKVTGISFPDGVKLAEAFTTAINAWRVLSTFDDGENSGIKPNWIESDSAGLNALLSEHFGLDPDKNRPAGWGGKAVSENPNLISTLTANAAQEGSS